MLHRRRPRPGPDRVRDLAVAAQHLHDGGDARRRGRRVRTRGGLPRVVTADVSARLAWPDDAPSIARVQLAAWRDMYADLLAPEVLDSLDADEFADRWSRLPHQAAGCPHARAGGARAGRRPGVRAGPSVLRPRRRPGDRRRGRRVRGRPRAPRRGTRLAAAAGRDRHARRRPLHPRAVVDRQHRRRPARLRDRARAGRPTARTASCRTSRATPSSRCDCTLASSSRP